MVETNMLSRLFLNRRKRRGSALMLSVILSMLMVILCSTIMMFTLQNFRMSKTYAKMNAGYYSSEENLEASLKFLQNMLKDCDAEAMKYVQDKRFKDPVVGAADTNYGANYKPDNNTIGKYGFEAGHLGALQEFYNNANAYWDSKTSGATPKWDPKNEDSFNKNVGEFLNEVYARYYFLILHEMISDTPRNLSGLQDESGNAYDATATNNGFRQFFLTNSKILNSPKDSGTGLSNSTINLNLSIKDPVAADDYKSLYDFTEDALTHKLKDYYTRFTGTVGGATGPLAEYEHKQNIAIKYVKNESATGKDGKLVHEKTMNSVLTLKVPSVNFVVSSKINYQPIIDNFNPIVLNAITATGNIYMNATDTSTVDSQTTTINGDVRAGSNAVYAGNSIVAPAIPADPGYYATTSSDYANHRFPTDINKGGVNVYKGILNVNGNLYTSGYAHTTGSNAKLSVNAYTSTAWANGYSNLKSYVGMSTLLKAWVVDFGATDGPFDSNGKAHEYTYTLNQDAWPNDCGNFAIDNASGGDLYCQKLKTEGTADNSSIAVAGKSVVDGSIQADGENSMMTLNGYYGINSGGTTNLSTPDASFGNYHSCIIQNAKIATITLSGNLYVPSRAYTVLSGVDGASHANKHYVSAESISLPRGTSIDAYSNQTRYITDEGNGDVLGIPGNPSAVSLNSIDYKPFSLYEFGTSGADATAINIRNQWKSFISYFTDDINKVDIPKSGVNLSGANGYISGIGINKDGKIVLTQTEITAATTPTNPGYTRQDKWYNSAKVVPLDDSGTWWAKVQNNQEKIKKLVYTPKTGDLYADRIRFTSRYLEYNSSATPPGYEVKTSSDSLAKVDDNLIIENGNVDLSDSKYASCIKSSATGRPTFEGIIIGKNVTIPKGYDINGIIVANGNVILGGDNVITYNGGGTKVFDVSVDSASTDPYIQNKPIVKEGTYLYKYPSAAQAIGLDVAIKKNAQLDDFFVKSAYHVDNMSRFTRTEWQEDDN